MASLVLLTLWLAVLFRRMAWQPLIMDELDFIHAARQWPLHASAVPHPPGYVHLLRLLFSWWGPEPTVARLPGMLSAWLALWLVPGLVSRTMPAHPRRGEAALVAVWLVGTAPLTVQGAMLVDIGNTVLVPATILLLGFWFAVRRSGRTLAAIGFGIGLGAALWFKHPPVLLLVGALALARVRERDARSLARLLLAAAFGIAVFVLTFLAHEALTGVGFSILSGTMLKLSYLTDWRRILVSFPQTAGVVMMWLTIPFFVLAAVAAVGSLRRPGRDREDARPSLGLFLLVGFLFYACAIPPAYGFPKYQVLLLPGAGVLAAAWIVDRWRPAAGRSLVPLAVVAAAAAAAQLLGGDPLRDFYRVAAETTMGQLAHRIAGTLEGLAAAALPLLAGAVPALVIASRLRARRLAFLAAALGAVILGQSAALGWIQAGATTSTRYHYGTDLVAYGDLRELLRKSVPPDAYVIAPKDVAVELELGGRFVTDVIREDLPADTLLTALETRRVDALVWTQRERMRSAHIIRDARVGRTLARDYEAHSVGEYAVFIRR